MRFPHKHDRKVTHRATTPSTSPFCMPRSRVPSGNGLCARSHVAVCCWFGYSWKSGSTLSSAGQDSSSFRAASADAAADDEHRGASLPRRRLCEDAGKAIRSSSMTTGGRSHADMGHMVRSGDPSVKEVSVRVGSSQDGILQAVPITPCAVQPPGKRVCLCASSAGVLSAAKTRRIHAGLHPVVARGPKQRGMKKMEREGVPEDRTKKEAHAACGGTCSFSEAEPIFFS